MSYETFMRAALAEARLAAEKGEIPVGAVVEYQGEVIARAHNLRETMRDATEHAEMGAIRAASQALGAWRLSGCTLFVTLEPCPMCAGAIAQARVERLVYGCDDPKAGATGTLYNIVQDPRLGHDVEVVAGVLQEECRRELQTFFAGLR